MSDSPTLSLDELLAHQGWVRRLARSLVADPAAADDLVQETWVAAMQSPPDAGRPPRPWLARVVTNLARQRHRGERRRAGREERGAREEALPSAAELSARLDLSRRVATAVAGLAEPYRSTVLLRYFEDLAPAEIARRQDLPAATVRSRLKRGLDQLRQRFDEEYGERERWCAAFAPLALLAPGQGAGKVGLGAALTGALNGILGMSLTLKIVSATAVVVALLLVARLLAPESAVEPPPSVSQATEVPIAAPTVDGPSEKSARTALATGDVGIASSATVAVPLAELDEGPELVETLAISAESAGPRVLRGRVVDLDGRPIGSVALGYDPASIPGSAGPADQRDGRALATSAEDGTFELASAVPYGTLVAVGGEHATVRGALYDPLTEEGVVVATLARPLRGRIVDPDGAPVVGARIRVALPRAAAEGSGQAIGLGEERPQETATDAEGRFVLAAVFDHDAARVHVSALGHEEHEDALPASPEAWELVLPWRGGDRPSTIDGRVVDADGAPVGDAEVAFGNVRTRTAADGTFHLLVDQAHEAMPLVALHRGLRPAVRREFGVTLAAQGGVARGVELELAGPTMVIAGRVVDTEGRPFRGVRVFLTDRTFFHFDLATYATTFVEDVAAPGASEVVTDDSGRFRLAGLDDREYVLGAFHERTLAGLTSAPIRAGAEGVVLTIARASRDRVLRGRVVDRDGQPIATASVNLFAAVDYRRKASNAEHRTTWTAGDGSFAFDWVPETALVLDAAGEGTTYTRRELSGAETTKAVHLVLGRLASFRVELDAGSGLAADGFELHDAAGEPVHVVADGYLRQRMPLGGGRTAVWEASDLAETLVLFAGEAEIGRSTIRLEAGETTVLRP